MTFTGFFRVDEPAGKLYPKGHSWADTTINCTPVRTDRQVGMPMIYTEHTGCVNETKIYMHASGAVEPVSDGSIDFSDNTGLSATEYAASAGNYIKSFTCGSGALFDDTQDFDDHQANWEFVYVARFSGTADAGGSPVHTIRVYKRDQSNTDTKLFEFDHDSSATSTETTKFRIPTGSVTKEDRLRIRVYFDEKLPT